MKFNAMTFIVIVGTEIMCIVNTIEEARAFKKAYNVLYKNTEHMTTIYKEII